MSDEDKRDDSDEESDDDSGSERPNPLEELNLPKDQIQLLKNAFVAFDHEKKGVLGMDMIGTILELLGHALSPSDLDKVIKEVDVDGSGELEFEEFCILASKFLVEEEEEQISEEVLRKELKEAFRYYDKEENGYITTEDFKEIIRELDPEIPEKDIDGMMREIDTDDSGTVDFEEFVRALR